MFKVWSVKINQYNLPIKAKKVWKALVAIVNVISLKCVKHNTRPKNVVI